MNRRASILQRLWNYTVDDNGCWLHSSSHGDPDNRAMIGWQGKTFYAYRLAWTFTHGPIPDGMLVCHRCDVPACIRPGHLFLGDQLANMRDAVSKGRLRVPRAACGDANPAAVGPDELVEHVRARYAAGLATQAALADELGIGQVTIGRWVRGEVRSDASGPLTARGRGRKHPDLIQPCGTRAGWFTHRRRGEKPCEDCVTANNAYMREYKRSRRLVGAA